jgi:hypothetical protein
MHKKAPICPVRCGRVGHRGSTKLLSPRKIGCAFVMVISSATIAVPSARASVVYSYAGNPFNAFSGPAFSGKDSVTGEFTVASALGDNFNGNLSPGQFSFSNGLTSITNFNLPSPIFDVQTSNTGQIIEWSISLSIGLGSAGTTISTSNLSDRGSSIGPTTFSSASNSGHPGVWSSTASTPLPPSLWLFATGFGVFGLLRWLQNRKAVASAW